jgi:hypothetical protein
MEKGLEHILVEFPKLHRQHQSHGQAFHKGHSHGKLLDLDRVGNTIVCVIKIDTPIYVIVTAMLVRRRTWL